MTLTNARNRSVSVTLASSGLMPSNCARYRSVSKRIASSGVLFPRDSMPPVCHPFVSQNLVHTSRVPSSVRALPWWCAKWRCRIYVEHNPCIFFIRLDWRRCLTVLQKLQQALIVYLPCCPGRETKSRKRIRPCSSGFG